MNRAERRRRDRMAAKAAKAEAATSGTPAVAPDADAIVQSIKRAVGHHNAGQLAEAESLYRRILDADPDQPMILHLLGLIAHQQGAPGASLDLFARALALQPDFADVHYSHGNTLKDLGRLEDARASFQNAVTFAPDNAEAHNNLGVVLNDLERREEAAENYQKALVLKPDFAEAHNNLGIALAGLNQPDQAEIHYRDALKIRPDFAEAHLNLGTLFENQGELEAAAASFARALAAHPNFPEAAFALGNAFKRLRRLDDAAASYQRGLAIKPDAEAHNNLGIVIKELGRLDDALAHYRKALDINPAFAEAQNNIGVALQEMGRPEDAIVNYRKAEAMRPGFADAGRNILYAMLNVPGLSPAEIFAEHKRFAEVHAEGLGGPAAVFPHDPAPARRLRIGYMSSDLRNHAVGSTVLPLLAHHDRINFEIYCYADASHPDTMTSRLRSSVDHWRTTCGKTDKDVADMIRADGIDILVCLAGRFDDNRPLVAALKAAPIQVSLYDGATSGLEAVDYWLTDDFLHPSDTREMFTETLHRLPVLFQSLPIEDAPDIGAPPRDQTDQVTFGSFNSPAKINGQVIRLWARILDAVPASRLVLKYKNLYAQPSYRDRIAEEFSTYCIEPERVVFDAAREPLTAHLARYRDIDIGLDPFPFNGVTTTFQALWMGVPVVSLVGDTLVQRASGSILHHIGLGDLTTASEDAYVDRARDLANDPGRLRELRKTLRRQIADSALCDAPAYARSIETAYRNMWHTWCAATGALNSIN